MTQAISRALLDQVARAVQAACLQATREGYERAGLGGLCGEGRWEMAVDAIQSLDTGRIVQQCVDAADTGTAAPVSGRSDAL